MTLKKLSLLETSAKKHDGVDTVFTVLVDQILQRPQVFVSDCLSSTMFCPSCGSVRSLGRRGASWAPSGVTWGPGTGETGTWAAASSEDTGQSGGDMLGLVK